MSKKIPAGICGILAGAFGIHKFIMGFPRAGMTMLGITAACWLLGKIGFPFVGTIAYGIWLIGFVEGIIYLVKNDSDFYRDYVIYKKEWF